MSENEIPYTPIKGYRELDAEELADMNRCKEIEAMVLATVALLREEKRHDARWLAIGQTHIEQGFMALNRAIAKPLAIEPPSVITHTRLEERLGEHSVG
jgi:hypothetical protein